MDGQGAKESGNVLELRRKAGRRRVPIIAPCYLTTETLEDTEIWDVGLYARPRLPPLLVDLATFTCAATGAGGD